MYNYKVGVIFSYCWRAYADALEVIPYTLAENARISPITTVTDLRKRHAGRDVNAGINVRKGRVTSMQEENVVQPLLVTSSAIKLATETVASILKIDDVVSAVRNQENNVQHADAHRMRDLFDRQEQAKAAQVQAEIQAKAAQA